MRCKASHQTLKKSHTSSMTHPIQKTGTFFDGSRVKNVLPCWLERRSPRVPGRQHETKEERTFRKGANTKKKKNIRNKEYAPNPPSTPPSSGVKFGVKNTPQFRAHPPQQESSTLYEFFPFLEGGSPHCCKLPLIVSTDACILLGLSFLYACVFNLH